ncbi:hypothetical protein XAPC_2999 [Xanthomonas citri pv. punicae str. LMG 859]|nr:hypothetical protein XAPC_2999 [Xanthomonas citri pv. punicae str. LMG 859]
MAGGDDPDARQSALLHLIFSDPSWLAMPQRTQAIWMHCISLTRFWAAMQRD